MYGDSLEHSVENMIYSLPVAVVILTHLHPRCKPPQIMGL